MKTIRIIMLMTVVALTTTTYAQKMKLGHINSNELLESMPERAGLQKQVQAYAKELTATMETMRKEYDAKVAAFQANPEMTELIKQSKVKEITDLEKRIGEFQQSAQADLQKKEQELLQPIIDKAKAAIDKVSKAGAFTYVFDSSMGAVLYTENGINLLPLVKKELGITAAK